MIAFFLAPLLAAIVANPPLGVLDLSPQPTTVSAADKTVAKLAEDVLEQIQTGKLDRTLLTPAFASELNSAAVASDATFLKGRGAPTRFLKSQRSDLGDSVRYVFIAAWPEGAVSYTLGIDKATNLIDALYFRPAATPL